jgi:molybdopterin biosynthesis enzyme
MRESEGGKMGSTDDIERLVRLGCTVVFHPIPCKPGEMVIEIVCQLDGKGTWHNETHVCMAPGGVGVALGNAFAEIVKAAIGGILRDTGMTEAELTQKAKRDAEADILARLLSRDFVTRGVK